ncbi:MAG: FAD-dependent oxidoreductase [Synergistaceae bacterium]|jgi:NADPH-dependent glutamate synthase beta subunit-like oxidoreductase/CO/xanthine dehydrogenase FAD-binding subunit|nr:FAD-dependent oxidoreductase [Synergistaceae bacterium]
MKHFEYMQAESFADAAATLKENTDHRISVMAGGTDLLGALKEDILEDYPETVIGLKGIKEADYIEFSGDTVEIGAMTRLSAIASSDEIAARAPILAEAAYSVATPIIRNVATIGGNVCQDVRCWFYRYPHQIGERFDCMRKGGNECYAIRGDNRYHSIFGGMKTHATPCEVECPAATDIPAYMERMRAGDIHAAARIIMEANPIPMITSRVCAHTCQEKCNRNNTDESVAIHLVERRIGDYILEHAEEFYAPPTAETGKSAALVGSGPAGLAAAYYLRSAGHSVTVIDSQEEPGGMLTYAIPSYRLPKHYVKDLADAYRKMGVKFMMNTTIGKDISAEELEKRYDKVFLATGAWQRPVLGFDGEEFTEFGLQFLKEVKQWVGKKERQNVLVVGGGNVAMDVAVTAKRLGAKSVTLACLEGKLEMPASAEEVARAVEEGVTVMNGFGVSRLLYDGEKINGMELVTCVSVFDQNGRFNPTYDHDSKTVVEADSVLVAAGQKADLSFIEEKYSIALNRGLIKVDEGTQKTSRSGVFAGGDATTGPATVIKAVRTGRLAAEAINREFGIETPKRFSKPGFITYDTEGAQNGTAVRERELPAAERSLEKEDSFTIGGEECLTEAKRCMNCGCYSVNASDISPALIALDAEIVTTKRTIGADAFFTTKLEARDMLDRDELVVSIRFSVPSGFKMGYKKFRVRNAIDFAIVSLAYLYKVEAGKITDAKLVLGGVAPTPIRAKEAESAMIGQAPSAELAGKAAESAIEGAAVMKDNAYKVQIVRALVKQMVAAMR